MTLEAGGRSAYRVVMDDEVAAESLADWAAALEEARRDADLERTVPAEQVHAKWRGRLQDALGRKRTGRTTAA